MLCLFWNKIGLEKACFAFFESKLVTKSFALLFLNRKWSQKALFRLFWFKRIKNLLCFNWFDQKALLCRFWIKIEFGYRFLKQNWSRKGRLCLSWIKIGIKKLCFGFLQSNFTYKSFALSFENKNCSQKSLFCLFWIKIVIKSKFLSKSFALLRFRIMMKTVVLKHEQDA